MLSTGNRVMATAKRMLKKIRPSIARLSEAAFITLVGIIPSTKLAISLKNPPDPGPMPLALASAAATFSFALSEALSKLFSNASLMISFGSPSVSPGLMRLTMDSPTRIAKRPVSA